MRIAAQIGSAYILLLLAGALWRLFPAAHFIPDLVTLFAAYLGLSARGQLAPSLAAAVGIGYLADLLYGTPVGLAALSAGLVCAACHLIQGRYLVRGVVFTMVFALVAATAAAIFATFIRAGAGFLALGWGNELGTILRTGVMTGLLGPLVFRICRRVDARFARTLRERDAAAAGLMF